MHPENDKIIDALLALTAERPWSEVTLEVLAERARVSLATVRGIYETRLDVLRAFTRRLDQSVLDGLDPHMAGEGARERLFDVLFSRIEALGPHRPALRNLAAAARRDPLLAMELNRIVTVSMSWMLTAAGIRATGAMGALRAQGLALVWSRVLQVWLRDEDPGLARTMAELDRQLRRSERAVSNLDLLCAKFRGRRSSAAPAPSSSDIPPDVVEAHPS